MAHRERMIRNSPLREMELEVRPQERRGARKRHSAPASPGRILSAPGTLRDVRGKAQDDREPGTRLQVLQIASPLGGSRTSALSVTP
jgi:hypothetical protein